MPHSSARRSGSPADLAPRLKIWLEVGGRYVFGHGMTQILQAVDQAGSIKRAAGLLGKSYRHVWSRIKEAEGALGRQLVVTQVGGRDVQRSSLTPTARRLVADFRALRARMLACLEEEFSQGFGESPPDR